MIPLPSVLAAIQTSVTGGVALAGLVFLACFGTRISSRIAQEKP